MASSVEENSDKGFRNALALQAELEEELPQLFEPTYAPKWNLYANEVTRVLKRRRQWKESCF